MTAQGPVYICPMHKKVRQAGPGRCPECGMQLLPEGTRFAIVRHMMASPMHMVIMGAMMAAVMMMWK